MMLSLFRGCIASERNGLQFMLMEIETYCLHSRQELENHQQNLRLENPGVNYTFTPKILFQTC